MTETPTQSKPPQRGRIENLTGMGKGRVPGPNKTTRLLKDAILLGAVMADAQMRKGTPDASGAIPEGTLEGYCAWLAEKHPQSFAPLLAKVLPIQIKASGMNPLDQPGSPITPAELGQALAFALRLGAAGQQQPKTIDATVNPEENSNGKREV